MIEEPTYVKRFMHVLIITHILKIISARSSRNFEELDVIFQPFLYLETARSAIENGIM